MHFGLLLSKSCHSEPLTVEWCITSEMTSPEGCRE